MARFHRNTVALLLGAGMLGASPCALGQRERDRRDPPAQEAAEREAALTQEANDRARSERELAELAAWKARALGVGPTVSLEFPGGSLQDYIESLKAAAEPTATNILVRGDAEAIQVGQTELRDVSLMTALQLVSGDYQDGQTGFKVTASNLGMQSGTDSAFLVAVRSFGPVSGVPLPREMLVLSLREMTTPLPGDPPEVVVPAETILTAVETVMSASGGEQVEAEIKYHPESGLLIVAGPHRALEATERVVQSIFSDLEARRTRAREIQQIQGLTNPDALQEQLADARAEAELAAVHAENADHKRRLLERRMDETRVMVERAAAPENEFRAAEIAYLEADAAVKEHRIRLERAQTRVARAEEALQRAEAIAAGGGSGSELTALREENAMLRDRLAAMEAQIAELRAKLQARDVEEERR